MSAKEHPMQPLEFDGLVIRFRANKIVSYLLDRGPITMSDLAMMNFTDADRRQFAQLIGYSVSGYGDLSYVGPKRAREADALAAALAGKDSA